MGPRRHPAIGGSGSLRRPAGRQPGSIHPAGNADDNHADRNFAADANRCPNADFHAAAYADHHSNPNHRSDANANASPYRNSNGRSNRNPPTYPAAQYPAGSHRSSRLYR